MRLIFFPLQCSCLENPRDRGAWWAAVYGVAQSRTWLMRLSSSSSIIFLLVKLLYLFRLKGYLSPSQLWLHINYVNLSLRVVPSIALLRFLSMAVHMCIHGGFVGFFAFFCCRSFAFSSKWNPFCHLINWSPMLGTIHTCWPASPLHQHHAFSSLPRVPLFSYTLLDLPPTQKLPGTVEHLQIPEPTGASLSIAPFLVIHPGPHITG